MHRSKLFVPLIALVTTVSLLAGCASSRQWSVTGAEREAGLVRVSYEYPEYREPSLSEEQALELAQNRCEVWGYDDARPIAGQLRQCSNVDNGNCNLWMVTREFQCTHEVAQANLLAR